MGLTNELSIKKPLIRSKRSRSVLSLHYLTNIVVEFTCNFILFEVFFLNSLISLAEKHANMDELVQGNSLLLKRK